MLTEGVFSFDFDDETEPTEEELLYVKKGSGPYFESTASIAKRKKHAGPKPELLGPTFYFIHRKRFSETKSLRHNQARGDYVHSEEVFNKAKDNVSAEPASANNHIKRAGL